MLKKILVLPIFLFFFLSFSSEARASLVTITRGGEVVINVLSVEDSIELEIPQKEFLEVKNVALGATGENVSVSLAKVDGKLSLSVLSDSGEKSLDVTNYSDDLVEIERRPQVQRLVIKIDNGKFAISQGGLTAETDYEININPKNAGLTLTTPSGLRYLSVLPREAANSMFRSKLIDRIVIGNKMLIKEEVGEELAYEVEGIKVISFFNIYDYELPVKAKVSATTGQIAQIVEPAWMKYLGFLFL